MYKYLYSLIVVFVLISCKEEQKLLINGYVPGNEYDGEWIYLVPFSGATNETIDSVRITDGQFHFEKSIVKEEIAILRTRPVLRLRLQELLVVIEPGKLNVVLNEESFASGTPLNGRLQQWKERKEQMDDTENLLRKMLKTADDSSQVELQRRMEKLAEEYITYNYEFVKDNRNNELGSFIYGMIEGSLTDQQKEALDIRR
ncbi:DUF4369 domain-containing protein [Parabacteroides sp. PF5-9]|uniref:DUF4369 domain-containing protein n=1 Tax=Parabacteroides sp. PF5-9 TaxID=1742404 RepID=UPI0024752E70|nr:DUF4369 domain-containing protein [Parabacteroides sp. PF5-9]MDH6356599.1 hypothetical protein [Parabacteroides sp. PF5-9]